MQFSQKYFPSSSAFSFSLYSFFFNWNLCIPILRFKILFYFDGNPFSALLEKQKSLIDLSSFFYLSCYQETLFVYLQKKNFQRSFCSSFLFFCHLNFFGISFTKKMFLFWPSEQVCGLNLFNSLYIYFSCSSVAFGFNSNFFQFFSYNAFQKLFNFTNFNYYCLTFLSI